MSGPEPPAKFSLALGPKKSAPRTGNKRPHSTLHHSDDEGEREPAVQDVSHFDASAGGAIDASRPKDEQGPLIIPKRANRNWHAESQARKRQKGQLPVSTQWHVDGDAAGPEEKASVYGLIVANKTEEADEAGHSGDAVNGALLTVEPAPPKTEDQLALEALLDDKAPSSLVVPIANNEDEAFHRDYALAPDVATLEEYEAIPVEQFGTAMLRGMGWQEGEAIGRRKGQMAVQPRIVEKRPALLGIGARSNAAIAEELGAWGQGTKGRGKPAQSYNPVVMRNRITGEQYTEEELKQKIADQEAEDAAQSANSRGQPSSNRDPERRPERTWRRHRYNGDSYESDRRRKEGRKRERYEDRERSPDDYPSKSHVSRRYRDRSRETYRQSDRDRRRRRDG